MMRNARLRTTSPRSLALRILAERFGCDASADLSGTRTFQLTGFQEEAVRSAARILARRGGVVIADGVGLGKTYVALALIEDALRAGGRVLVTTPAALRREWTRPLARLRGAGPSPDDAASGGTAPDPAPPSDAMPQATAPIAATPDAFRNTLYNDLGAASCITWISHERLSRGGFHFDRLCNAALVVVDEAHAFRSPRTRRYRALAELCRGARVVLLTATPVNNSLWDLYFLLRLFSGDAAFRDIGVPNLKEVFRVAATPGSGPAPPSLAPVLAEVVIRRTRVLLRDRFPDARVPGARAPVRFPRCAPPMAIRYSLDAVDPGLERILAELEGLTLAALRVGECVGEGDGAGGRVGAPGVGRTGGIDVRFPGVDRRPVTAARHCAVPGPARGTEELVRAGLLKRLESSLAAFRASVRRQLRFHEAFLDALDRGRLLGPADHRALYSAGDDGDPVQLVLEDVALRPIPPGLDVGRLRRDAAADRERLARILARTAAAARGGDDPKLARLITLLDRELRGAHVVVFSEFRDTARHLWRALVRRHRVALVDGTGAFLGTAPSGRRAVIERFAPAANGARPPAAHERVDILIATDVLSEGLNLQDADHVISYDLPWNPVRLIQRIGRVDRLGSPHDIIHAYHFLPDRGLDRALGLLDRLRSKLAAIGRTVGHEAGVLDTTGTGGFRALVDRLAAGDAEALDALERADASCVEAEERLRSAYEEAARREAGMRKPRTPSDKRMDTGSLVAGAADQDGEGTSADGAAAVVPAAVIPVGPDQPRRVLVAHRAGTRTTWTPVEFRRTNTPVAIHDPAAATAILTAALAADHTPDLSPDEPLVARALAAAAACTRDRATTPTTPPALPPSSAAATAARRLLAALAAIPGGPTRDLCDRCDALLANLARPHDAGTETAIRRALAETAANGRTTTENRPITTIHRALTTEHATPSAVRPSPTDRAIALLESLSRALERARPPVAASAISTAAHAEPVPAPPELVPVGVIETRPAHRDRPGRALDDAAPVE